VEGLGDRPRVLDRHFTRAVVRALCPDLDDSGRSRDHHRDMHHRRSTRLPGWDYSADGDYFVTLCSQGRLPIFGHLLEGRLEPTDVGRIVTETWRWLPLQYRYVTLDAWCLMPDHLHGVVRLGDHSGTPRKTLGRLIGAFKTVSTHRVNQWRQTPGVVLWQRGFFDRLIRDAIELDRIRTYIQDNAGGT
jgi:putative transposase